MNIDLKHYKHSLTDAYLLSMIPAFFLSPAFGLGLIYVSTVAYVWITAKLPPS